MRRQWRAVSGLTLGLMAFGADAQPSGAERNAIPAFSQLKEFAPKCGYVTTAKDHGGAWKVIVVGEYHRFADVQKDVECLLKEVKSAFPAIQFLGKEGLTYGSGTLDPFLRERMPSKLALGVPIIGIEDESYQWTWGFSRIEEIDKRHAELSKKKMETGLAPEEYVEYNHVSQLSYEIIVRKRSWEWIDNVNAHMEKTGLTLGLLNTGFGHFPTMAERLGHHGISYLFLMPNAARNYCTCEAYWHKTKPDKARSCKAVCDDPAIEARWD